jgi:hypothetical protein
MSYGVEDEIDWSDSPLDPPSPEVIEPVIDLSSLSPAPSVNSDELFVSGATDDYTVPPRSPVPFSTPLTDP